MNPRATSPVVPASAVIPGDIVVHPGDGFTKRVEAVSRQGDTVVLSFAAAAALALARGARVTVR